MIVLDAADLAVIAAGTLGIGTDEAIALMDIPAARAALAEARDPALRPAATLSGRDAAAAAAVGLVHALLRYRPFPREARPIAVCAGLQFLSLNGWRADLDPPATAAVVIDALAAGQLAPADAAAWLSQRLSPVPRAHRLPRPRRAGRATATVGRSGNGSRRRHRAPAIKAVASALATALVGGVAILATACSSAPDQAPPAPRHAAPTSQVTGHPHHDGHAAVLARK